MSTITQENRARRPYLIGNINLMLEVVTNTYSKCLAIPVIKS